MSANVSQGLLLDVFVAIGVILGFRAGSKRQLIILVGVGLAYLVSPKAGPVVPEAVHLGQESIGGIIGGSSAAQTPAPQYNPVMDVAIFALMYLFFALVAAVLTKRPKGFSTRLFGALLGGITWFIVATFTFPRFFQGAETTLVISGSRAQVAFSATSAAGFAVVLIIVLIGLGMRRAAPPKKKSS